VKDGGGKGFCSENLLSIEIGVITIVVRGIERYEAPGKGGQITKGGIP
jgi:hypothetical protein